jgi:hypothetical protein
MSNGYSMDIFVGDSGNIPKKTFTSATSGYYGGYPVGYSLEYYLAIRGIFLCSLGHIVFFSTEKAKIFLLSSDIIYYCMLVY